MVGSQALYNRTKGRYKTRVAPSTSVKPPSPPKKTQSMEWNVNNNGKPNIGTELRGVIHPPSTNPAAVSKLRRHKIDESVIFADPPAQYPTIEHTVDDDSMFHNGGTIDISKMAETLAAMSLAQRLRIPAHVASLCSPSQSKATPSDKEKQGVEEHASPKGAHPSSPSFSGHAHSVVGQDDESFTVEHTRLRVGPDGEVEARPKPGLYSLAILESNTSIASDEDDDEEEDDCYEDDFEPGTVRQFVEQEELPTVTEEAGASHDTMSVDRDIQQSVPVRSMSREDPMPVVQPPVPAYKPSMQPNLDQLLEDDDDSVPSLGPVDHPGLYSAKSAVTPRHNNLTRDVHPAQSPVQESESYLEDWLDQAMKSAEGEQQPLFISQSMSPVSYVAPPVQHAHVPKDPPAYLGGEDYSYTDDDDHHSSSHHSLSTLSHSMGPHIRTIDPALSKQSFYSHRSSGSSGATSSSSSYQHAGPYTYDSRGRLFEDESSSQPRSYGRSRGAPSASRRDAVGEDLDAWLDSVIS